MCRTSRIADAPTEGRLVEPRWGVEQEKRHQTITLWTDDRIEAPRASALSEPDKNVSRR
jgi:hypothetical protein